MSLYNGICEKLILPLGDWASGQKVLHYLDYFNRSQYWPREKIEMERDRLIRETVSTAYHEVPFYKELYSSHGIVPEDIRTADDLSKLPPVSKSMLTKAGEKASRPVKGKVEVYSTSGSTGNPFSLRVDADTISRARALMVLRTLYSGYRSGDRVMQTGTATERGMVKWLKDKLLRVDYVSAFDLTPELIDQKLEAIQKQKIHYLTGYAQSLDLFASRAIEVGFNFPLKAAVSWGALLLPQYRERITKAFNCFTYDSYGVGEGMQVAAQCGQNEENFHVFNLAVHCEAHQDGQPLPDGELGELLLTRLNPGPTPLIRYQIGDMGRMQMQEVCPCGRNLPIMRQVVGRTSDIILTPNGKKLVIHFFTRIFSTAASVEQFQIIQKDISGITLKLVAGESFDQDTSDSIVREIQQLGDPDLKIKIELVDSIPVGENAKRRYIISELN